MGSCRWLVQDKRVLLSNTMFILYGLVIHRWTSLIGMYGMVSAYDVGLVIVSSVGPCTICSVYDAV